MAIPTWVDFESAERSAAVMARGLSGSSEAWGTLLAHAQAVLAARTDKLHFEVEGSYDFEEWRDLVAAARILDLAATDQGVSNPDNRRTAAILAACAFGMSGTAVSATSIVRNHRLLDSDLGPGELTTLAISSPILSRDVLPRLPAGSAHRTCIENVAAFLARGAEEQFSKASRSLQEAAFEEPGAWESYLLRLSSLSLAHVGKLATARVLMSEEARFPRGYLDRLVDDSPLLLPSQYEAITEHGILRPDENLLIALPTGTGKTLLGELALLSSLGREPGLVCYIAPYVALGRQVAEKISRHTPPDVRVHRLMGGYKEPEPVDPEARLEVIVATPERFDAMLRLRPDLLPAIRCVVFDEAHMISNGERGVRLEGILTRLRLAARTGQVPRFVLLSAVLSNTEEIATWLGIRPTNVISGTWRPSAKRLLRWAENGTLQLHAGDDPLRKQPMEVLGETNLPWPNAQFYPTSNFGAIQQQEPRALQNIAFLAEYEYKQYEQPILCVCSTRPRTRRLAAEVAERFEILEPIPQTIRNIVNLIDQRYSYLRPLREAVLRGVAYHNSSLPHDVRERIEQAVESRALKVVTATTTLAEGVDLPFRATILGDWLMFDGEKSSPMESLLFKNIAGRCGRAGQFTEGDTIIFDNPVGDAQLTSPARRPQLQERIFFSSSQPTLESAMARLGSELATSTIGSQLLAAISENPDAEDIASSFGELSFAYQTDGAADVAERVNRALSEILDDSEGQPLATMSSPVRLTSFGEAANSGGLSPTTARRLRTALSAMSHTGSSRDDLIAVSVRLLRELAVVPEQGNPDLKKAVASPRSRPIVRLTELELVLDLWLNGESLEDIFAALPSKQRSSRQPRLEMWLEGVPEDSTWTDQFAKFYDFMNNCVVYFLPWILRAAEPLVAIDGHPERPWTQWANLIEFGADSSLAAGLVSDDIITDRALARKIGQRLEAYSLGTEDDRDLLRRDLADLLSDSRDAVTQVFEWFMLRENV